MIRMGDYKLIEINQNKFYNYLKTHGHHDFNKISLDIDSGMFDSDISSGIITSHMFYRYSKIGGYT